MNEDFVTRLGLQLRAAAERDVRRSAPARALAGRSVAPALAGAVALVAVVAAIAAAALWLRGEDPPAPAQPQVVATLHVTEDPGQVIDAFGSIWIADEVAGRVVRVDPATREVQATIALTGGTHLSMSPVGSQLWVSIGERPLVERIDPATDAVVARTPLRTPRGRPFPALDVVAAGGTVWAVSDKDALRLDPRTGAGIRMAQAPPDSQWFTLGPSALWSFGVDGTIHRLDPRTGAPQISFPAGLPGAETIGAQGDALYAASGLGEVARLDPATGAAIWSRMLGTTTNLATESGWVLVSAGGQRDRLVQLDTATGRTLTSTPLDTLGATGLAERSDELWLDTAGGDTVVLRQTTR